MGIANLPIFQAMGEKLQWQQTRQGLLSENVANAESPGFVGKDLRTFNLEEQMRNRSRATLTTSTTSLKHYSVSARPMPAFNSEVESGFEVTPEGNSVGLETEMMKVAQNQMDYQSVTALYKRSTAIFKLAIARNA